ncbi:ribonuclease P protein component [Ruficoccus amylovorans]|uniref:Ribonuclease P protein component n=1 Tax=Ruficoccus amylovorans TaxID=1804625 RepID=A0A842HKM7_9BACT|nr:ribonuclease P protein component [Ruficoccus amylovorans]MBC2596224.1 ribonuclease P protein component [Ruficoccus amylovorans]
MRYRAAQHLRTRADFDRSRREGFRADNGAFIMRIYPPREGTPPGQRRFGVIASRRVGNAVKRNRAKRQMREIFRLNQHCLPPECDVLIIVRSQFDQLTFDELQERYLRSAKKCRLS